MRDTSAQSPPERQSVVDGSGLVEGQVGDLFAERAGVDRTDHLAEDTRRLISTAISGWKLAGAAEVEVGQMTTVEGRADRGPERLRRSGDHAERPRARAEG